ncbi:MucBP domain-containing protein [Enterococcus faecium]|uniref:MucBP domain-containing protein n=1 Tax=Enterococcus faecium TaxID=1352 RepID=UPI0022436F15|nr:MucBP domain-containing protein [Enterococcus faecium]MCW8790806.1 MucBP domain-containing protein [Enterococcus faecium]
MSKIVKKLSSIALLTIVGASLGANGLQLNSNILGHNTVAKAEELDKTANVDKTEKTIESNEVTQSNQKVVNESEVTEIKENTWNYSEELIKEGFQALPKIQGETLSTTENEGLRFKTKTRMYFENDTTVREPKVGDIVVVEQSSNDKLYGTHRKFDEPNLWVGYDNLKYYYSLDKEIVDYYDDTTLELLDTYVLNGKEYNFETDENGKAITSTEAVTYNDVISNLPISMENTHVVFRYKVTKVSGHRNTINITSDIYSQSHVDSDFEKISSDTNQHALYYTKVNYVDFKTKEKIAESDFILNDADGDKTFYAKEIDGYLANEESKTINVSSTVDSEITFFYNPDLKKKADITVRYVDEQGNDLLKQEIHKDLLTDKYYEYEAKEIDGYNLISNKKQGIWLRLGGGEIIFTYSKDEPVIEKGRVIVNYLDEDGNKIVESKEILDFIGNKYFVSAIDIDGYIFNEQMSIRNQGGVFTKEDSIINFIYRKVVNPTDPTEPTNPVVPEPEQPVEPTEPTTPTDPEKPTDNGDGNGNVVTDTNKETTKEDSKKEDKKDKLYQTNHSNNNILIALATTALASVLAFITFKKFKK